MQFSTPDAKLEVKREIKSELLTTDSELHLLVQHLLNKRIPKSEKQELERDRVHYCCAVIFADLFIALIQKYLPDYLKEFDEKDIRLIKLAVLYGKEANTEKLIEDLTALGFEAEKIKHLLQSKFIQSIIQDAFTMLLSRGSVHPQRDNLITLTIFKEKLKEHEFLEVATDIDFILVYLPALMGFIFGYDHPVWKLCENHENCLLMVQHCLQIYRLWGVFDFIRFEDLGYLVNNNPVITPYFSSLELFNPTCVIAKKFLETNADSKEVKQEAKQNIVYLDKIMCLPKGTEWQSYPEIKKSNGGVASDEDIGNALKAKSLVIATYEDKTTAQQAIFLRVYLKLKFNVVIKFCYPANVISQSALCEQSILDWAGINEDGQHCSAEKLLRHAIIFNGEQCLPYSKLEGAKIIRIHEQKDGSYEFKTHTNLVGKSFYKDGLRVIELKGKLYWDNRNLVILALGQHNICFLNIINKFASKIEPLLIFQFGIKNLRLDLNLTPNNLFICIQFKPIGEKNSTNEKMLDNILKFLSIRFKKGTWRIISEKNNQLVYAWSHCAFLLDSVKDVLMAMDHSIEQELIRMEAALLKNAEAKESPSMPHYYLLILALKYDKKILIERIIQNFNANTISNEQVYEPFNLARVFAKDVGHYCLNLAKEISVKQNEAKSDEDQMKVQEGYELLTKIIRSIEVIDFDVTTFDERNTILHFLVLCNPPNIPIIQELLSRGAKILPNKDNISPFDFALQNAKQYGNCEAIINIIKYAELSTLELVEAVNELFDAGYNLDNIFNREDFWKILNCLLRGEFIRNNLISIFTVFNHSYSSIDFNVLNSPIVCFQEDQFMLEVVLKILTTCQDIAVELQEPPEGNTLLHYAVSCNPIHPELVIKLIRHGADLNIANAWGLTPLSILLEKAWRNQDGGILEYIRLKKIIELDVPFLFWPQKLNSKTPPGPEPQTMDKPTISIEAKLG